MADGGTSGDLRVPSEGGRCRNADRSELTLNAIAQDEMRISWLVRID